MADTQLAAQLYTLRDFTQTPADIARTFEKLAAQGWQAVQASAMGPIDASELKKILDANGLVCCATHTSLDQLDADPAKVVAEHEVIGCGYTAVGGYFPKAEDHTEANWRAFAKRFADVATKYDGTSLSLGYHNHSHEWAKLAPKPDAARAVDVLVEELPDGIWWEWDTYWIAHAGGNPAAWIERFPGRVPCVHLKDLGVTAGREQYMMEIDAGNLDWPGILDACRSAGTQWYIVEQDTCWRDPFDSLKTSLENLRAMGLR